MKQTSINFGNRHKSSHNHGQVLATAKNHVSNGVTVTDQLKQLRTYT